jgi:hypothetical protein
MDNNMNELKININCLENNIKIDNVKFKKMTLLFNALEEGWSIKKINDSYIFEKKFENKKEIFSEVYLERFIKSNININKLL